ncbi:MAG: fluoride efflux transporter CrcB [Thermoguttaceae bacterium]|jgi:CrcB protein|nr:fluoride efflux transporter CrcB [Thermoguttaceae bacterium]
MWYKLIGLAVAGAIGALARYGVVSLVQRDSHSQFPWGTLAVNIAGCFLFGLVWTATQERLLISSETRVIILAGFLGSFTTFSAFLFETDQFLEHAQWFMASVNVIGELGAGLMAYLLGAFIGRLM